MGKPNACTAKQPNEACLVCTTNLQSYASASGDEGKGVIDGQRIRTSDVIQIYYVFGHQQYFGVAMALCKSHERACVAKLDLLQILRARTCSRVTSQLRVIGARFEFLSTGWYRVRDTPKQRVLTWDRTKYGSATCRQRECVRYGTTASLISESETSVDWNQNVTSQSVTFVTTRFTTLLIVKVTCKHVNVKVYHVKFEVIRKYFFVM